MGGMDEVSVRWRVGGRRGVVVISFPPMRGGVVQWSRVGWWGVVPVVVGGVAICCHSNSCIVLPGGVVGGE